MPISWQLISNFPYARDVQTLVRTTPPDFEKFKKLANDIFNRYLSRGGLQSRLQTYMNLCFTVNDIRLPADAVKLPHYRTNRLMQGVAALLAASISQESDAMKQVKELAIAAEIADGTATWFYAKLWSLQNDLERAVDIERFVAKMIRQEHQDEVLGDLLQKYALDARKTATEVIRELTSLRKYGVKSSFFQDGALHDPSQAWVFVDPNDLRGVLPDWYEAPPQLAIVSLTDRAALVRLDPERESVRVGKSSLAGVRLNFPRYLSLALEMDGEFDGSHTGMGFMPVRNFFARRKSEHLYDVFRLLQAIRLYDLVVPVATVAKMPHLQTQGLVGEIRKIFGKRKVLDLVIPRLRTLENVDRMAGDLELELEQDLEETARRAKRERERHEVVYHIRRLPKGKRATAESRERAERLGIVLTEHETFVRAHERGKGELPQSVHRARVRS